jgi:hypothetical protein
MFLRLIMLLAAALFVRRLMRLAFASSRRPEPQVRTNVAPEQRTQGQPDLSRQDISDADFEEIP